MTYRCPVCGWSKTVRPRSDALMPGDYFDRCPNCSHAELELHKASLAAQVFSLLNEVTGNRPDRK